MLKSGSTEARIRAVEKFAVRGDDEDTPALLKAARDASPYVAKLAVDALCERAGYELAARLTEEFSYFAADGARRDPGCVIRAALAHLFGRLEYGPARDVLRDGIRSVQVESLGGVPVDSGAQLRGACALALAEMRATDALSEIVPLLFDQGTNRVVPFLPAVNAELRVVAARAIGRLGLLAGFDFVALPLRFPAMENVPEVVAECMEAALALDAERALPLVCAHIDAREPTRAAYGAMALVRADQSAAADAVGRAAEAAEGDSLRAICLTLAMARGEWAHEVLWHLARTGIARQRIACVEAYETAGGQSSLDRLREIAASDGPDRVCAAAHAALTRLGATL